MTIVNEYVWLKFCELEFLENTAEKENTALLYKTT